MKTGQKLDLLINNAGIMGCPFALSKQGHETQFATNHLGHFLFTTLLIPALLKAEKPRIVNLSSLLHKNTVIAGGIDFEHINTEKYSSMQRYSQSKLANVVFTHGLNKRFGDKIAVNAAHPGIVDTGKRPSF